MNVIGNTIPWSKLKSVHASSKHPGKLFYKTTFDSAYLELNIFEVPEQRRESKKATTSSTIKTLEGLKTYNLEKLYTSELGITAAKHKGLMDLCRNLDIPEKYHTYYKSLPIEKKKSVNVAESEEMNSDDENREELAKYLASKEKRSEITKNHGETMEEIGGANESKKQRKVNQKKQTVFQNRKEFYRGESKRLDIT